MSHHRFPVYLESEAWATNFKTKLASGSAVLIPSFKHPEFFARELIPYVHYVPIDVDDLCEDLVSKVGALSPRPDFCIWEHIPHSSFPITDRIVLNYIL